MKRKSKTFYVSLINSDTGSTDDFLLITTDIFAAVREVRAMAIEDGFDKFDISTTKGGPPVFEGSTQ